MQTKWWSVQIMQLLWCKINLHDITFRNRQPAIHTLYYGALMLIRSEASSSRWFCCCSVSSSSCGFFPACSCSHPPFSRIVLTISFFLSLFSFQSFPFFLFSLVLLSFSTFFFQAMLYFLQQTHSDIVTYYPTSTFSTQRVSSSHLYSAFIFAFLMHYLLHLKYEISEETVTSWNKISTTPIRIINF